MLAASQVSGMGMRVSDGALSQPHAQNVWCLSTLQPCPGDRTFSWAHEVQTWALKDSCLHLCPEGLMSMSTLPLNGRPFCRPPTCSLPCCWVMTDCTLEGCFLLVQGAQTRFTLGKPANFPAMQGPNSVSKVWTHLGMKPLSKSLPFLSSRVPYRISLDVYQNLIILYTKFPLFNPLCKSIAILLFQ
jgi:hypothetical protein